MSAFDDVVTRNGFPGKLTCTSSPCAASRSRTCAWKPFSDRLMISNSALSQAARFAGGGDGGSTQLIPAHTRRKQLGSEDALRPPVEQGIARLGQRRWQHAQAHISRCAPSTVMCVAKCGGSGGDPSKTQPTSTCRSCPRKKLSSPSLNLVS